MGFIKNKRSGGQYAKVMQGKIVIPCEEDDDGAVSRINKNKDEVWEKHYDGFEGHITNVKFRPSKDKRFPDSINITVKDKEEGVTIIFDLAKDSNHAITFFQVMQQIKLNRPVAFEPYYYIPKGKTTHSNNWAITQNGEKLEYSWDKDELPEWKKKTINGQTVWDKTKQIKFFMENFNQWVEENFSSEDEDDSSDEDEDEDDDKPAKKKQSKSEPAKKKKPAPQDDDDEDEDEDDDDDDDDDEPKKKKDFGKSKSSGKGKRPQEDDDEVGF